MYDASVEMDLELGSVNGSSSGRDLVWQASQSPCDALNKLMDDAQNGKLNYSSFQLKPEPLLQLQNESSLPSFVDL